MIDRVRQLTNEIEPKLIRYRRDFHKYAESGWTEFRTASLIARRLVNLGYEVRVGREVMNGEARMGVPGPEVLEEHWHRAVAQGGDKEFLEKSRGGFTGVVGILHNGKGPIIGMRFDIDALDIPESQASNHRPIRAGFASVNDGVMHACGHDGHAAIGLGVAEILMKMKNEIHGTVKLIFQPAEEGVRGAKSMVSAGVVDDVDYMLGHHLFTGWAIGDLIPGMGGFAATQKFDAVITGKPAHAGGSPEAGKNALMAAATATLNLYAIPRHSGGSTRVNVGKLTAGTGRNVICPHARMVIETRGADSELSDYMYENAVRILKAATEMYNCELEILAMGGAESAYSDNPLAERVQKMAEQLGPPFARAGESNLSSILTGGGSEDFTYMMKRVQENGGLAACFGMGADLYDIGLSTKVGRERVLCAHTSEFDIHEGALKEAVKLFVAVTLDIMATESAR